MELVNEALRSPMTKHVLVLLLNVCRSFRNGRIEIGLNGQKRPGKVKVLQQN